MKRGFQLVSVLTWLAASVAAGAPAADSREEDQLAAVLQSPAPPRVKDAACARLKRIGTARCVPALAALLTDEQLSHSARYALESLPAPEAGRALTDALARTTGLLRVGVINSLGLRRETPAVPALVKLLGDSDPTTAAAAAAALGKIGGLESRPALEAALATATGKVRAAVVDALLACAHERLAAGDPTTAASVFQRLCDAGEPAHVRAAAYRGLILASGDAALARVISALEGNDGPSQAAAIQSVRDLPDPKATPALAALLPKLTPALQVALIEALAQRGDRAAAPGLVPLAQHTDPAMRAAAISALGLLGDASAVPVLLQAAAAGGTEQKAARQALLTLRHGDVTGALLSTVASGQGAILLEAVRALGGRADTRAVPPLLNLAQAGQEPARAAALQALGLLADAPHVPAMVRLVLDAKTAAARVEARTALEAACRRIQSRRGTVDGEPIASAVSTGPVEARLALLPVCSGLADARIRAALRQCAQDPTPEIRTAALRALCDTRDPELLPDLLTVARDEREANLRVLAVRGVVRLATEEEAATLPLARRLDALRTLLRVVTSAEDKRLVLAGLANLPDPEALRLALSLLDLPDTRAEAAQAATRIAGAIAGAHPDLTRQAVRKVLATAPAGPIRRAAETVLKQLDAATGFITNWEVAGPYEQSGKNHAALFDVVFPPETGDAKNVSWRKLPVGSDPKQPWRLDLLKFLGGEQRVAYVRTRVHSEREQPARLELGTDDGVKVWLNGRLVHANNVARPLAVGSDTVDVTLQPGWNTLLLKITQNNLGWEFCARLIGRDGARLDGVRLNAPAE